MDIKTSGYLRVLMMLDLDFQIGLLLVLQHEATNTTKNEITALINTLNLHYTIFITVTLKSYTKKTTITLKYTKVYTLKNP